MTDSESNSNVAAIVTGNGARPESRSIFVSHCSRDSESVTKIIDMLLPDSVRTSSFSIVCTDADRYSPRTIQDGTDVWASISDELQNVHTFIACLSDDYFRSEWCVAELEAFHRMVKDAPKGSLDLVLLMLDSDCDRALKSPFAQGERYDLGSRSWITKLLVKLRKYPGLAETEVDKLNPATIATAFNRDRRERKLRQSSYLADVSLDYFAHRLTTNGPITSIVNRSEYEQISVRLGLTAQSEVLWTLYGSPLLVPNAYRTHDKLLTYERDFASFSANKTRVVIFDDWQMAEAYLTTDETYHNHPDRQLDHPYGRPLTAQDLTDRKKAFESSVENSAGSLLFTTVEVLKRAPGCSITRETYLEFAYYEGHDPTTRTLLVDSGFSSGFAKQHVFGEQDCSNARHINFFPFVMNDDICKVIKCPPYDSLLGHFSSLQMIVNLAKEKVANRDDGNYFVTKDEISLLEHP
jgi:hypothetical protein